VVGALVAALKDQDVDVRAQAAGALGEIKSSDDRVVGALVAALKDKDWSVRAQAAGALGKLERVKALPELLVGLKHLLSGYRTAAAQALAQKDIPIDSTLQVIAKLKEDKRPWVRLGAWEAYELLEPRREAEKKSAELLHEADSLFASGKWQVASGKYKSAFEENPRVTRTDSLNAARAKFQQARCAVKLKRAVPALDDLKIALEYNPTWRDTLQAELAQPNNDWAILQGNWCLREVLLKR
jgi:tetratricopeptide (TPR) repeat protein